MRFLIVIIVIALEDRFERREEFRTLRRLEDLSKQNRLASDRRGIQYLDRLR